MRISTSFVAFFCSLALAQEQIEPCKPDSDDCTDVMNNSACYNGAVTAGSEDQLLSCFGEDAMGKLCSCYGCDRSLMNFVAKESLCMSNSTVPTNTTVPTSTAMPANTTMTTTTANTTMVTMTTMTTP